MGLGALKKGIERRIVGKIVASMLKGSGWLWRLLDGWKTWIVAVVALVKLVCVDCGPSMGYVDAIIRALGWDGVAGAFDPKEALAAALVLIALGHKLLKAIAQFRAGAKLADLQTPKGAAALLQAPGSSMSLAAFSIPVVPEWAKVVLGVLRRLLNAGADKGLWYERQQGVGLGLMAPAAISLPTGWWAKLRAKLLAFLEQAINGWLEGSGHTVPPVEPPAPPVEPPAPPVEPPTPPPVTPPPIVKPTITRVSLIRPQGGKQVPRGDQALLRIQVEYSDGSMLRGGEGLEGVTAAIWRAQMPGAYAEITPTGSHPKETDDPKPVLWFGPIIYGTDKGAAANLKAAATCPLGDVAVSVAFKLDGFQLSAATTLTVVS